MNETKNNTEPALNAQEEIRQQVLDDPRFLTAILSILRGIEQERTNVLYKAKEVNPYVNVRLKRTAYDEIRGWDGINPEFIRVEYIAIIHKTGRLSRRIRDFVKYIGDKAFNTTIAHYEKKSVKNINRRKPKTKDQ